MSSRFDADEIHQNALTLSDNLTEGDCRAMHRRPLGGVTKRLVDIAISALAFLAFLPIFGLVAITILLLEGRPVFYRHSRIGFGRRSFQCLKFRTMVSNSEQVLDHYLREH